MRIIVYCETHDMILDEGEVSKDSSLILWNDFTKAKKHLNCFVLIRLKSNHIKGIDNKIE